MKKYFICILAFCMLFCLCACGNGEVVTDNSFESEGALSTSSTASTEIGDEVSNTEKPVFTVKVVDGDGNAVAGVMVQLCKDSCIPAKTDDNGCAVFNVEITDGYKVSVMSCPEGYSYDGGDVYIDAGSTEYTLEIVKGN